MDSAITVVVVDDHPLFRSGVVRTLDEEDGIEVVAEGASADEAVDLVARHMPTVALLDISMPGNGIAAAGRIAEAHPTVRIAMLTASESDQDVMKALEAGATGYVLKGVGAGDLVSMIRGVAHGESYVSPSLAARLLVAMKSSDAVPSPQTALASLTEREEQILRLVANGLSNKEVGRELDLQEKTVKHHMTSILQKLHARNRVEAAVIARENWGG
ncbi:MAG TPA: response regulator transcription factor [Afifellaceae bacterium]|nr:response regulator transcription factor [Afifellaceae bacterium]